MRRLSRPGDRDSAGARFLPHLVAGAVVVGFALTGCDGGQASTANRATTPTPGGSAAVAPPVVTAEELAKPPEATTTATLQRAPTDTDGLVATDGIVVHNSTAVAVFTAS